MSAAHDLAARAFRAVDPESGHKLAVAAMAAGLGPRARSDKWPRLKTTLAGLSLPNPIGLAAGFDKDARCADGMLGAGFGFVECGTVTPLPQPGNPKPRLFRLMEDRAAINRMGFNNDGLEGFARRLAQRKQHGIVGANVGANKESADRAADYVIGMARVWPFASYITANISSPNPPGLRGLQERGALEDLLGRIAEARGPLTAEHGARPVFLKVAPDLDESAVADIVAVVLNAHLDGIIVSNTTIARPGSLASKYRSETGGLSGRPLFAPSTEMLRLFARAVAGRVALIGAGGIEGGGGALAKIKAGANAVQLYTALVFEGPTLAAKIARSLAARLEAEGFAHVADAVGADLR